MKRPFISELAELGLSGEILSIRTDGMQGTLIPDLTAGVSEAGRVKTGNWVISDKRTFDHVVLCGEHEKPRGSHRMMPSTGVKITTIIS